MQILMTFEGLLSCRNACTKFLSIELGAITYTVESVGGSTGQDPVPSWLNQPPVFPENSFV